MNLRKEEHAIVEDSITEALFQLMEKKPIAEELDVQVDQLNVLEYGDAWITYNVEATPTLIYFDKGQEVNRLVGDAPEETIHQFFNEVVLKK